jgi:serine/threonine protein kinase
VVTLQKPAVQTFGKYQILERIATGGMAEIYKARLEGIGGFQRTFAIKRILPHLSQNAEYVAMLVDEAKVAGLLSHANIVQILDLGQVDGVWYIAMEYVEGRDLGGVLRKARDKGLCLPVPHTVFVAIELLKGLEYAHQRQVMRGGRAVPLNIIHRDISPPNILMSFQGEVKLTDFGIARASHKALETQSGIIKGRFDYMSPEQAAGAKDLDQRSDLFSVGVVLYEMLTGEHPFRSESELGTLEKIRLGRYVPVSQKNPDVPFTLETIVDRSLRVDRNERYPTATAFKEALDKFFHDSGFIFTHSTLAAYMRGLYPDPRQQQRSDSGPPRPSILPSPDELGFDVDGEPPTKIIDGHVRPEDDRPTTATDARGRDSDTDASVERPRIAAIAALGPGPGSKDDATLIRANPLQSLSGVVNDAAQWADEQETQIRPGLVGITPQPVPARGDTPTRVAPLPAYTPASPEAPTPKRAGRQDTPARRGTSGVLLFVVAMTMLGMGILLGAAGVAIAMQVIVGGTRVVVQQPARLDPLLLVQAPPGATVTVNGVVSAGTMMSVGANQPQAIRVQLADGTTWEQTLTLGAGELRVLQLQNVKLGTP